MNSSALGDNDNQLLPHQTLRADNPPARLRLVVGTVLLVLAPQDEYFGVSQVGTSSLSNRFPAVVDGVELLTGYRLEPSEQLIGTYFASEDAVGGGNIISIQEGLNGPFKAVEIIVVPKGSI